MRNETRKTAGAVNQKQVLVGLKKVTPSHLTKHFLNSVVRNLQHEFPTCVKQDSTLSESGKNLPKEQGT